MQSMFSKRHARPGALSPAYKTYYEPVREEDGRWKSSVYFECHSCDVSLNPATGQPFWTAKSHVDLDGEARKIDGRWFFPHVSTAAVPVPVPVPARDAAPPM